MSGAKPLLLFLAVLLAGGCTVNRIVQPQAEPELPVFLQRSRNHLAAGTDLLAAERSSEARLHFDRALDILLDVSDPSFDHQEWLQLHVDQIAHLELQYFQDRANGQGGRDDSFLEQVISTPLFLPSVRELQKLQRLEAQRGRIYDLPVVINSQVAAFLKAFQGVRQPQIQEALNRAQPYLADFRAIFREQGLPEDLVYLPIIESGFRTHAVSRARATGMWQFMAATARLFGLRVDWQVDERLDPYKSARAAARYLDYLFENFKDWYLVLASYNGGPGRIQRAINRLGKRDFFAIAASSHLVRETKNYVPAFLASLIIAKDPEGHGFTVNSRQSPFTGSITVTVPSPVSLDNLAKNSGVPGDEIRRLNPELLQDFTPFNQKTYELRLPAEAQTTTLSDLQRLPPEKELFVGWYKVKKGDTLYGIARQFRTTVQHLKNANKLRSNLIKPGQQLLIPRRRS